MLDNLSPITHATKWGYYRVPCLVVGREYRVSVDEGVTRVYDDDTLPDFLKNKIAMIIASGKQADMLVFSKIDIYINHAGEEFDDIGWRFNNTIFMVILTAQELASLQGEALS